MKKNLVFILGLAVVLVGIVLAILFAIGVFGGTEAPETKAFSLDGTWTVAAVYNNDVPTFVENQYMVFTDTDASMYKDDISTPFASSKYTLDSNHLKLSDISHEYTVAKKTDNCVRLYDTSTTYTLIVRNNSAELNTAPVDVSAFNGRWDIVMKGDLINGGEAMTFSDNSLNYYKSGSTEPVSAEFTLADNVITIETLNMVMNCHKVDENTIMFIEQSGIVWELSKSSTE